MYEMGQKNSEKGQTREHSIILSVEIVDDFC